MPEKPLKKMSRFLRVEIAPISVCNVPVKLLSDNTLMIILVNSFKKVSYKLVRAVRSPTSLGKFRPKIFEDRSST